MKKEKIIEILKNTYNILMNSFKFIIALNITIILTLITITILSAAIAMARGDYRDEVPLPLESYNSSSMQDVYRNNMESPKNLYNSKIQISPKQ
jgi:hypothetical protein